MADCTAEPRRRGWCGAHYQRWLKHGDPLRGGRKRQVQEAACTYAGCQKPTKALGLCGTHYYRQSKRLPMDGPSRRPREPRRCAVPDCDRTAVARGWCGPHHKRWSKHGDPLAKPPRKKRITARGNGAGGRMTDVQGYIHIYWPEHPNARADGKVLEHTVVMAEHLGRPVLPLENVHHRNGQRDDNRIENLELWTRCQPTGKRVRDLVSFALEVLNQYGDDPTRYP